MMADAWLRLEAESSRAFNAFCKYRDMAPDVRSYEKVREDMGAKPTYVRQIERWASQFNWVQRATLYDDHTDGVQLEATDKARREMSERQAKVGMLLQSKGVEKIKNVDGGILSTGEAIRAIESGTRIERVARGEPSEIQKSEHTGSVQVAVGEISDEDLLRIISQGGDVG